MITISPDTKISSLIKANSESIEAIASINPHFNKLRNPILRKILASRVTISEAARIGKCSIECFAEKLRPLGFDLVCSEVCSEEQGKGTGKALHYDSVLDVRDDLANGKDPFNLIMKRLNDTHPGEILLLVNSFEPFPLIKILERKKYTIMVQHPADDIVHTYIQKPEKENLEDIGNEISQSFEQILMEYEGNLVTTDVRHLPMPQPMLHILEQLERLPDDKALFVQHKKIPMFLLPELKQNGYKYAIKEDAGIVLMLIYKDNA